MNMDAVDLSILGPAFLAGLLVLATHVPFGQAVLKRGIIFIDLAIAQIAGLGVILVHSLYGEPSNWMVQVAASATAIGGAFFLSWTERRMGRFQEAVIGILFVLAASMSILLLADNPHAGERLKDLLVGQILWVDGRDLYGVVVLYAIILAFWFGLRSRIGNTGFYILFSLNVMASVQLVGIYLVFASLIIPALATVRSRYPLPFAYVLGIAAYLGGLLVSAVFDLPSGPVIVMALASLGVVGYLFLPNGEKV
jgi:zinc/manganese transport system permease protein